MNELPSTSDSPQSSYAQSSASAAPARPAQEAYAGSPIYPVAGRGVSRRWIYLLVILMLAGFAAQWWYSQKEISVLREEVARRLQTGDTSNNEIRGVVKSLQEETREVQAKVSVLDSKQTESQSQQLALEQLYQDLSKNRDEWALSEVEGVLSTASQQLQLGGNVQGALIALQNADKSLSRSDKPQFIAIRRAIARDLDRLKALPTVDVPGIALRIDSVIGQIDGMPLLADEKPVASVTAPKKQLHAVPKAKAGGPATAAAAATPGVRSDWLQQAQDAWQSFSAELWTDVQQLVRVRSVETPEALLLSPTQSYYVRENLKLRLLNARLALLSHNEEAFRSDLLASQDTIAKYFDTRARQTQVAQALIKQVQGSNLSIEMPTLSDSINAVRNYKAKP
ncbi:MAG TPA: uroporphyrinogen-III C-methyltransferase [Herbaspirillum sp.]|jgi:uroporphyrin-3 C-methyltransferase/uroporphyrinogen III methyltransferase/synthase